MSSESPIVVWPAPRRPTDPFTDFDDDGFYVFVPAIMSVGLVFSIVTLIRDAFRWTGSRARDRRTALEAQIVVQDLVRPVEATPTEINATQQGLLARAAYLWSAIVLGGAALYIAFEGLQNYLRDRGSVQNIAWLLTAALLVAALLGYLAVVSVTVYRSWPVPPSWTQRTLRTAPLTINPQRVGTSPPAWLTAAVAAAAVTTSVIVLMVATGRGLTKSIDEPIVEWLTSVAWLDRLGLFDPFGSTLVAAAFVALIGLSSFRCRVMAVVYPAAFAIAWITVEVLQDTIARTRPNGFDTESFPSGHMVQVVFIAGLLPPALHALLSNRRLVNIARAVLTIAAIATAVHRVHIAKHWPLDVLGGLAIGTTIVLTAQWVLEHKSWHQSCPSCPWSPHPGHVPWQRGVISLRPATERRIGYAGSLGALLAAAALGIATVLVGLPEDPEGSGLGAAISAPVQLGLAALMVVAAALSVRWKILGAFTMAVTAVGLGVFSSVQYHPLLAIVLTAALLVPAFLTWLSWQPTATLGGIVAVAVLTTTALTGTALGAREVHEHYFGPTHPTSLTAPLQSDADWIWLGAVTENSATITAGPFAVGAAVDLQYWAAGQTNETTRLVRTFADEHEVVRFDLQDLAPATTYRYRVLHFDGGRVAPAVTPEQADASFVTFADGAQDLEIAIGSCARRTSNGAVFDAIVDDDPDLYLAIGDLHYGNIDSTNPSTHIREYARSLSQPAQSALFRSVPTAYVWDDHDYGPNDADGSSRGRAAVSEAYRTAVPDYGVEPSLAAPIAQAFTIGRVRIVMTDTRSERDDTTMLGADQLAWLLDELVEASASHALVIWANPTPWIGDAVELGDTWASYPDERARIAQVIADAGIENLVMVSGDAHMVAIDDGRTSGYASDGSGGFPILHAAALDRPGSVKGGPYSHGTFPGGGQYGRVRVVDDGGNTITVRLSGHRWDATELVDYELSIAVPASVELAPW